MHPTNLTPAATERRRALSWAWRAVRSSSFRATLTGAALAGAVVAALPAAVASQPASPMAQRTAIGSDLPAFARSHAPQYPRAARLVVKAHVVHVVPKAHVEVATTRPVSAPAVAPRPAVAPVRTVAAPTTYGCGPAIAWLSTHSAPGFTFECPGYSLGHQAMTCVDVAGVCPGMKLITIAVPCAAAYMNEASNSWVLTGQSSAAIDPYGYCH